jgi:hypothetical protein
MMVLVMGVASRFSMGGTWAGHFADPNSLREQGGAVFRVTAQLVDTNGKIDGTMTDLEPSYEVPYKRYIQGMRPNDFMRCEAFARRFTNVTVRLSLPERSRISGRVSGEQVEMVKCYDGPQTVIWLSEGKEIEKEVVPNHRVLYHGRFDQGGEVLDGQWTIRQPGLLGALGRLAADGSFHLVRQTS